MRTPIASARSSAPATASRRRLVRYLAQARDRLLDQEPQDRVEGVVGLAEVHVRAAVAEILEAVPALRARPERLADRLVVRGHVRHHVGDPLPRLSDAAREQVLRHAEIAVTDQA